MANIITAPESGIYFDGNTAGVSNIPTLTGDASGVAIQYDGYAGIEINSFATGSNYLDRFSVEGANGRLFGVTDEVTGTVFSVNDAAGLPIIDVESTADHDKITIGEYGSDALVISGTNSAKFNVDVSMTGDLDVTGSITMTGDTVATQSWVSSQSYLTSETDDQTLDEVLAQGNTSSQNINVGDITGSNLTLDNNSNIYANGAGYLRLGNSSGGKIYVSGDAAQSIISPVSNDLYIQTERDGDDIIFKGGASVTEIMRLDADTQRVGIGTSSPSKELDVVGDIEVYNSHSAVNVGSSNNIATGNKSIAFGIDNLADGSNSLAIGQSNDSHGNRSIAIGVGNDANENDGVVVGQLNTVNADAVVVGRDNDVGVGADISIGQNNWVSGTQAVGVGVGNTVSGNYAQIFGRYNQGQFASVIYGGQNTSQSYNGVLFGQNNDSSGDSQAFGKYNYVTGAESTAIGRDNVIDESYSLAAGWENKVYGSRSAAVGYGNVISGNYSSAFGYYTVVGTNNTTEIGQYNSAREREGAVRIHDNHLVAISMRSGTAPSASTANDGFESETSLASDMYTIQRNGSDYILYHNLGGSIESTTLGAAEADTLQTVTDRGNVTTTSIKAAHISGSNLTLGNGVTDASIFLDGEFGGGDLTLQNGGNNQDIFFKVNDGGVTTTPLTIQGSTSNVGVNTASPSSTLQVVGHTISINTTGIAGKGLHIGDSYNSLGIFGSSDVGTHYNPESLTFSAGNRNSSNSAYIEVYSRFGGVTGSFGDINLHAGHFPASSMEGDISLYTNGQKTLVAKHDGNVGIGTTSPQQKLHVEGTIRIGSDVDLTRYAGQLYTAQNIVLGSLNSETANITVNASTTKSVLGVRRPSSGTTSILKVRDYSTQDLYVDIDSDGNADFAGDLAVSGGDITLDGTATSTLTIGTSYSFGRELTLSTNGILPTISADNQLLIETSNSDTQIKLEGGGSTDNIQFVANEVEQVRITTAGVGIGTSSPSCKLHIKENGYGFKLEGLTDGKYIRMRGDGSDAYIDAQGQNYLVLNSSGSGVKVTSGSSSTRFIIGADSEAIFREGNTLKLRTNSADRLFIDSSGNVGIGTTSPSKKLDVVGDIKSSATVEASGLTLTSLSNQSSEATALVVNGSNQIGYRELGSAAFSATSTFATAAQGTSANTAFGWGNHASAGYAPLASPALTGNPTAPTQSSSENSTKIATTAYVKSQGYLTSLSNALLKTGGTMSGAIAMGSNNITGGGSFFANLFSVGNEGKVVSTSTQGLQLQATAGSKPITFYTNVGGNTERMRITHDGNVGIGTTAPDSKLHVVGSVDSDAASLGSEIVASQTASGTNWSGSSLASGYTHSAGSTDLLVSNLTPTVNRLYRVEIQTTNVTAGRLDKVFFGGLETTVYLNGNTTRVLSLKAMSTGPLTFECQSAFVGTVTVSSVKEIVASDSLSVLTNSGGNRLETRVFGTTDFFLGDSAGENRVSSSNNIGIGNFALQRIATAGINLAIGNRSLSNLVNGSYNVAIGHDILGNYQKNGNVYNIGIGNNVMDGSSITGHSNIVMGFWAGADMTSASGNLGIGYAVFGDLTSGGGNLSLGNHSLTNATSGGSNIALGASALQSLTTTSQNIAIGYLAGRYAIGNAANETPSSSIYIGYNTKAAANGETNQIVIGTNAEGIGANTVTLGNDSVVTTALKGDVGIGTTSPSAKLHAYQTISTAPSIVSRVPFKTNADAQLKERAALRIDINEGSSSLSIGGIGSAHGGFIQSYSTNSTSTHRNFVLNPFGGNVGIGFGVSAAPTEKLHVNGTFKSTGASYFDSTIEVGSSSAGGVILTSPGGGRFLVTINNSGELQSSSL